MANQPIPHYRVPHVPTNWDRAQPAPSWDWAQLGGLPPLLRADGAGLARWQTKVRLAYDAVALWVRFDCDDEQIWGSYTERDAPIYDEEVVEVFLSPGPATPTRYYEFELSPNGVLLDALIDNPHGDRATWTVDLGWDAAVQCWAWRNDAAQQWGGVLGVPWAALVPSGAVPTIWRANFYRIERPSHAAPEFSCWSPTFTDPADFHKPAHFGVLELVVDSR
jgi:hypothetical protein